jgi:D-arabinose 1-dehydrogenase-like Zn-dependent alcohol dehydrogenase
VPPRASNYCKNIQILGLHVDGAHAKYVVVLDGAQVGMLGGGLPHRSMKVTCSTGRRGAGRKSSPR